MNIPQARKHAEVIKAWADGATIEYFIFGVWQEADADETPIWAENIEYRIKPEPTKFPQTKMTDCELTELWVNSQHGQYAAGCNRTVANAAIERSIRDGDVVPAEMLGQAVRATIAAGRHAPTWREIDVVEIVKKVRSGAMAKAVG